MTRTACLNAIYDLAKKDDRVVFIGSDLSPVAMKDFKRDFPDRFFMEGVNEQNCVSMAAGLAMDGYIPYVNTIATFLTRRCYEQVVLDVCLHDLPVRLIGNGGGLVYAPLGATHCAIEDMAIMSAIPNMTVVNCADNAEMTAFMGKTLYYPGPLYIRLGKDDDPKLEKHDIKDGEVPEILFISTGIMSQRCVEAAKMIERDPIIACEVMHVAQVKPLALPVDLLNLWNYELIVAVEEGIAVGGLGSAVQAQLGSIVPRPPIISLGLPDAFPVHYGEREDLLETYGLTSVKIAERVREACGRL